jgi:rhamnopyranosyl-N-acetylglucosaminyl-diphospho-decaprenol beta-1,3/1,4-galactofuranosyltransferase
MRILAHIHTFNDEDVIDKSLQALLDQTCVLPEILIVDNGSTDRTLDRPFPAKVTVIRHSTNLGTSGAVATGMRHAIEHGYDWIWILDADSVPGRDTLQNLVDLYRSLDASAQRLVGVLSCTQVLLPSTRPYWGRLLTPGGPRIPKVDPRQVCWECDITIWSGSLVRLDVVRASGLPRFGTTGHWEDFCCDYGDIEFFHRVRRAGFKVLCDRASVLEHQLGHSKELRIFGRAVLTTTNHSPERRYLYFRNLVYFWLYLYPQKNWVALAIWFGYCLTSAILRIGLIEENSGHKIWACLRGVWDGSRQKLNSRYS